MATMSLDRTFDQIVDNVRSWCRYIGTQFTIVETTSGSVYLFIASPQGLSVEPMRGADLLSDMLGRYRDILVTTMANPTVGRRLQFRVEDHNGHSEPFDTSPLTRVVTV